MPAFPWLEKNVLDGKLTARKMKVLRSLGVPYTDAQIAKAQDEVKGKTEMDAVIAYLQSLGQAMKARQ